jgi:hypothetical protein
MSCGHCHEDRTPFSYYSVITPGFSAIPQLKEEADNVERSYKLMLEPEYLSAEVRATLWLWHFLGLESQSLQHKPKNVRTNVRDLLEFLARLNFHFAKRALARLPAAEF